MSKLKLLQKMFLKEMSSLVEKLGFDKKIRGQSFWKKFDGGRVSLHFSFIDHKEDFDITTDFAIRFDELEDYVNAENNLLSKKEKEDTYSLGVELGNLTEGQQKRWTISDEADITNVTVSIIEDVQKHGIPYFTKYSNKENAFVLLSNDDREVWIHSPFHAARAKRAIALAVILNKNEMLKELIKSKISFIISINDFGLEDFKRFLEGKGLK